VRSSPTLERLDSFFTPRRRSRVCVSHLCSPVFDYGDPDVVARIAAAAPKRSRDRCCGVTCGVVQPPAGSIEVEPVRHMEVLFKVVGKRKVQKGVCGLRSVPWP
jgi:hypothetical protein